MDELQRKVDEELKKNTALNKKTFGNEQLEDIVLTKDETRLRAKPEMKNVGPVRNTDLQNALEKATGTKIPGVTTLSAESLADSAGKPENTAHFIGLDDQKLNEIKAQVGDIPKPPKTIADLLSIEADVAKNPPKAPATPKQSKLKENLKNISYYQAPESPIVRRLRTLKGDVEEAMRSGKATLVSMASAEVTRQSEQRQSMEKTPRAKAPAIPSAKSSSSKIIIAIVSIISSLLIVGGIGAVYFFQKQALSPIAVIEAPKATAFIPIQFENRIITDRRNASYLKAAVAAERKGKKGNLNEMGAVYLSREDSSSVTGERSLTTREFFNVFDMRAPEELTRTLSPNFMLGIHRFPENQSFLIFKTDSYESAASGMFVWENNLEEDVGKFLRTPIDFAYASTTNSLTNRRVFKDAVIKNNDARAIYDDKMELLFFYAFLKDRETLIMATNAETLGEIITGLSARKLQR